MATKNGARLTKAYTDAERRAVLEAHLIDGLTIAETERQAMAGTLRPDLGPFGRPRFAYNIVAKGRDWFEAESDTALDSGSTGELKRLTRLALAKARELGKDSDPAEIARRAKALAETHRALRGAEGKQRGQAKAKASASERVNGAGNNGAEPQANDDTLAQLVSIAGNTAS